jgi:hypothetical protein
VLPLQVCSDSFSNYSERLRKVQEPAASHLEIVRRV